MNQICFMFRIAKSLFTLFSSRLIILSWAWCEGSPISPQLIWACVTYFSLSQYYEFQKSIFSASLAWLVLRSVWATTMDSELKVVTDEASLRHKFRVSTGRNPRKSIKNPPLRHFACILRHNIAFLPVETRNLCLSEAGSGTTLTGASIAVTVFIQSFASCYLIFIGLALNTVREYGIIWMTSEYE